jgi:hypothetical protein
MTMNDVIALLMDVPPKLAGGWAAWFAVGLILSIWGRRERARSMVVSSWPKHKSGVRAAAASKPFAGVRAPVFDLKPVVVPQSAGDAFGELERLLEPESLSVHHRMPGETETPVLTESPAPSESPALSEAPALSDAPVLASQPTAPRREYFSF